MSPIVSFFLKDPWDVTQRIKRVLPGSQKGKGSHDHCHVSLLQDTECDSVKWLAGFPGSWETLWVLRIHSPAAESSVLTDDQMAPQHVAIYHNREKWVLSSRNELYQLWESWPLLWLDKDGGVTPTAKCLLVQGLRTLLRLDRWLGPTSRPSDALSLPLGQKVEIFRMFLCVELIYWISYALPTTAAVFNGEVFLLRSSSLHALCLAGQKADASLTSFCTGAFVPGKE